MGINSEKRGCPAVPVLPEKVRIGVVKDETFSFHYAENLELLCRMGAELVEFSPLHDRELPPKLDGLLLGGGYFEKYAGEPEQAGEAVRKLCEKGMPCLAGCCHMAEVLPGAGLPHLYYYGNPQAVFDFMQDCLRYQAERKAREHWDDIAKPIDGLGLLESYVVKLCRIAGNSAPPDIKKRALLVLCGDHGVVEEGVTQCGSEVTKIVAANLAEGCSTVNIMAEYAGVDVYVIDAGMEGTDYPEKKLVSGTVVDRKVGKGCKNIAREAAMTVEQCRKALQIGQELVEELKEKGYTIIATGEMGIGNTTPTSALAALFLGEEPETVTGRGAGLDEEGLRKKREAVRLACERVVRKGLKSPLELLAEVGGFEIAMMSGVFLGGVRHGIPIVVDGVISAVAALVASKLDARVPDFLLASHISGEPAGQLALQALGAEAILHGRMHLGEGTGAVALFPLLDMAVEVYTRMGSFGDYDIEAYERMTGM